MVVQKERTLHKFSIKSSEVAGIKTKLEMDGSPLKGAKLLNMNMVLGKVNTMLIEFIPGEVDVEVDAVVKAVQPENPGTELVDVTELDGDGTRKYVKNPKLEN